MATQKISLSDFSFQFSGYGHYNVMYRSPKTGKKWHKTISDMTLIDCTKNAENPTVTDLERLKAACKA